MRLGSVAVLVLSTACAHGQVAAVVPSERVAPVVSTPVVEAGDPIVGLRLASATALEVSTSTSTTTRALDLHAPHGVAVVVDVRGTRGLVVPLGAVIDGTAPQAFAIEPSSMCATPWLVDVDADPIEVLPTARGVPDALRAGCGPLQHTDFVTAFGRERVFVYGEAPFDARMVASELGIVRTELERIFEVRIAERWLNEIIVEPAGHGPTPRAAASPNGLRIHLDGSTPWGAAQRLEVGSTIARIWLGKLLDSIAPAGDAVTPQRAALLHGVARGIARESLFELGLLSPDDYAADLDRAEMLVADRGHATPAGIVDGRDVAAWAAARSIEAAVVAWTLRESPTPMSLPHALRSADEGGDALRLWATLAGQAKLRKLGGCIVSRKVKTSVVDLGYTTPWDPVRGAAVVTAMRDGAPAVSAGLRVGDEIRRVVIEAGVAELWIARDGGELRLEPDAKPQVITRRGWRRRNDVADDRCYPRV